MNMHSISLLELPLPFNSFDLTVINQQGRAWRYLGVGVIDRRSYYAHALVIIENVMSIS